MKDVMRCTRCGATYPPDHARNWGHNRASDGLGQWPKCGNRVPAQHAPLARDHQGNEHVPEEVCGGMLSLASVANDTPVEDPGAFGRGRVDGPQGVWRAQHARAASEG